MHRPQGVQCTHCQAQGLHQFELKLIATYFYNVELSAMPIWKSFPIWPQHLPSYIVWSPSHSISVFLLPRVFALVHVEQLYAPLNTDWTRSACHSLLGICRRVHANNRPKIMPDSWEASWHRNNRLVNTHWQTIPLDPLQHIVTVLACRAQFSSSLRHRLSNSSWSVDDYDIDLARIVFDCWVLMSELIRGFPIRFMQWTHASLFICQCHSPLAVVASSDRSRPSGWKYCPREDLIVLNSLFFWRIPLVDPFPCNIGCRRNIGCVNLAKPFR